MKKSNFSLHNLLNNDKFLLIISFLIAITLWVNVSPQREITVNCPVTINTEKTSAQKLGLEVIDGKNQNFSVVVQGKWYNISDLTANSIDISYSFAGVTDAGKYEISISATKANNNDDFKILSVTPEKVSVTLDHIVTKEYQITTVYNNIKVSDEKVYSIGDPIINDGEKTIQITGPATKMDKIEKVVAEIPNEEMLTKTTVYKADLKFYDKNGSEVDTTNFTLPYDNLDVTLPLNETKTVPIKAIFENVPSDYASNPVSYSVSQKEIKLIGTKEALAKTEYIELEAIDYKELTPKNHTFKKKLILPSGIKSFDGVTHLSVNIDMNGFSSKKIEISNFRIVNTGNYSSSVETKYKSVNIVGKAGVIENLENSDLYIECDLTDASVNSGSITVQGTVKSSKYKNIWGTGDCEIRIRVAE